MKNIEEMLELNTTQHWVEYVQKYTIVSPDLTQRWVVFNSSIS